MMEYKFHGELGYFVQVILGPLERYVNNHPENKGQIKLYTLNGYD